MSDKGGIDPRQRVLRPKREDGGVLRLLASGMSLDAIQNRLSIEGARTKEDARGHLEAILAHAVALVGERSLLPPAATAFLETNGVATSELDSLRSLSERLLRAWLSESSTSSRFTEPNDRQTHQTALRYAEALVRQEEVLEALGRVDSSNAPLQNGLTGPDRKRIDDFLLYRNIKGRFETLDSLMGLWERSVAWVERNGDSYLHDEFVDRLSSRDSLEDALSLLSPTARRTPESHLRPLDERFADATRSVSTSIRPHSPWQPQRWWWFRVPLLMGEPFQARLEHVAPAAAEEALAAQRGAPGQPGLAAPD